MKTDITSEASEKINQDRGAVFNRKAGHLLVVADGAGGMRGGEKSASIVITELEKIKASKEKYMNPLFWSEILSKIDRKVLEDPQAGESTAVIAFKDGSLISGASVGDSEAWLIQNDQHIDLTELQIRKPLIGSGIAGPMPFGPVEFNGTLLQASDGLFKYGENMVSHLEL